MTTARPTIPSKTKIIIVLMGNSPPPVTGILGVSPAGAIVTGTSTVVWNFGMSLETADTLIGMTASSTKVDRTAATIIILFNIVNSFLLNFQARARPISSIKRGSRQLQARRVLHSLRMGFLNKFQDQNSQAATRRAK